MKQQRLFPDRWRLYWTSDRIPGVYYGDIVDKATAEAWVERMNRETQGMGLYHWCEPFEEEQPAPQEPTP